MKREKLKTPAKRVPKAPTKERGTNWGGARPGAGRKPGSKDRVTADEKTKFGQLCRDFTERGFKKLKRIINDPKTPPSVVANIVFQIFAYGWGRPTQSHEVYGLNANVNVPTGVNIPDEIIDQLNEKQLRFLDTLLAISGGEEGGDESEDQGASPAEAVEARKAFEATVGYSGSA